MVALSLVGCAEPADAPAVSELDNPVIETAAELDLEGESDAKGFTFRVTGDAGPVASYALDGGAECLAYGAYIVRLTPVEESDAHTIEIVKRPDGTSPLEVCSADGDIQLPTRAGVDTFVALDETILWTTSDSQGRDLLTGYDFETKEEVFSELVTPPVLKDADGLTYGGPLERMASMDALEAAGVVCPEARVWFSEGRSVAISRRLLFSFESSETSDAGEALCLVVDDA
jgi:hypothetical protein